MKARIFEVPGNAFACTSSIDESFILLTAHVDESVSVKISKGEYVNLAKLIQKDKIAQEEDND